MQFDSEYVTSGIIWGSLWDATMQWLLTRGYTIGYTGDVSQYGNYVGNAVKISDENITIMLKSYTATLPLLTGQSSYTKINNIYDLAGNYEEATMERFQNSIVKRGGNCDSGYNEEKYTAARTSSNYEYITSAKAYTSTRPYFFIK